jgi:hypothetical protein
MTTASLRCRVGSQHSGGQRAGHGMPKKLLAEELSSAGFQVVKSADE